MAQPAYPSLSPLVSKGVFGFQWTGDPNITYRVQSTTNVTQPGSWVTEDLVAGSNSIPVRWTAPEVLRTAKFYRLALPEPEIVDVEPAIVQVGVPVDVYIIGQNFGSNDVLRLGPLTLTNRIIISPTLIKVTITPSSTGVFDFSLLSAATGKTSTYTYSWTVDTSPPTVDALLEPPTLSVATPIPMTFKQKIVQDAVGEMREPTRHPAKIEVPDLKMFSGEMQISAVDMVIPGRGLDFVLGRTYRSRTGATTAQGNGWDFSYNLSIQPLGGDILFHGGNGRDDVLRFQTNGTYSADGLFLEGSISNNVFRIRLADGGQFVFNPMSGSARCAIASSIDRNGNTMSFAYDGSGRLQTIVDDLGRTNSFAYDQSGQLHTVTDFSGRTVTYNYYRGGTPGGAPGDLATVTSPPVIGTPNGNDFPTGKTTTYTYTTGFGDDRLNHNLASVTDGKGQAWLQVFYRTNTNPTDLDFDAVDYVQRGPYRLKLRRVAQTASPTNGYATLKAIINDGVGNVSECFYDSRNRCVRELQYTGRANPDLPTTEVSNRPTGKLRPSDPDFYETRWEWNPDSLCTREILPSGEMTEMLYQRAYNQNSARSNHGQLHAADVRVIHDFACCDGADTDGDGINDVALRSWYFQYDPRFGTVGSVDNMRQRILDLESKLNNLGMLAVKGQPCGINGPGPLSSARVRPRGWDPTTKQSFARGPRQTISLDGSFARIRPKGWDGTIKGIRGWQGEDECLDFVTQVNDPNGNITTAGYDAKGNCLVLTHQGRLLDGSDSLVESFGYNAVGQVMSHTNAPDGNGYQRVDLADYYTNGPPAGYLRTFTVDTQGPVVTLEYDARGNVTRYVDPRGNDTLCTYNALDECVRSQSSTNLNARCVTDCFYDANDNLLQTTIDLRDAADTKYSTKSDVWSFDALNRCVALIEQVSDQHFLTNGIAYDGDDNAILLSSPEAVNGHDPTNVTVCVYDERNLLFQEMHGPGLPNTCTNEYVYDANGRCLTVTVKDALGNPSPTPDRTYAYDGFGRCVTETDAMGNVQRRYCDRNDNVAYCRMEGEINDVPGSAANQLLSECRYDYDSLNRCTRSHYSFFDIFPELPLLDGESTTSWSYAPNGACLSVTDDNSHTTHYTYDTVGRLSTTTDAKNDTITYVYDNCANPLSETRSEISDLGGNPQVFVTYCTYDNLNRCVTSSDNVGNTNRFSYDSLDRCVTTVDKRGFVAGRVYDDLGRCVQTVVDLDQDGLLDLTKDAGCSWTWDDNSRCVAATDANSNATVYAYDSLDRCVTVTNADHTACKLVWSPRSNILLYGNANHTTISNTFDGLDRCVRRDITPGPGVATTTTFEVFGYDGCSRLVSASNDASSSSFRYNSLGACVFSVEDGLTNTSAFDGVANRTSMTYPSGRVVTYTYDALDQVTTLNSAADGGLPPSNLLQYSYDGPGRMTRIFRSNSMATKFFWDGLVSPPNVSGDFGSRQVSGINHAQNGGATVVDRRAYAYDRSQNKIYHAQSFPGVQSGVTKTNSFAYDSLDRMQHSMTATSSSVSQNDYSLDRVGNRLAVTNNGAPQLYSRDATLPQPGDFEMDQYTITPFGQQSYDDDGNLLLRGGASGATQYHYDYADRLVEVDTASSGGFSPVATFSYDALGRCVSKTVYPPAPLAPVTTQYTHDSGDCDDNDPCILEQHTSGVLNRVYLYGGRDNSLVQDYRGIQARVAFTGSGQAQFYHCDELGNVLALTDSKGKVLEHYDYDDFGMPSFYTSDGVLIVDTNGLPITASQQGNPFLFHGMFWDDESALYEVYRQDFGPVQPSRRGTARLDFGQAKMRRPRDLSSGRMASYDPQAGRYLLRAGIPLRPGANSFTFAGDNPWSGHGGGGGGGCGIAIDEPGVQVAGIAIDEPGVQIAGIAIDEPGVHVAGIAIDEPGVQIAMEGYNAWHYQRPRYRSVDSRSYTAGRFALEFRGIVHRDIAARIRVHEGLAPRVSASLNKLLGGLSHGTERWQVEPDDNGPIMPYAVPRGFLSKNGTGRLAGAKK